MENYIRELAGAVLIALAGCATIIEVSPIKFNPWSALAKAIGRAINSEVLSEVNKMKTEVSSIKDELAEQRAINSRVRILRFGDELLHDVKHSKEHFDQILKDITDYENYCETHPKFENDMTVLTTERIKEVYSDCWKNHTFL